jgi:hypothetical protein
MKRLIARATGLVLVFALVGRYAERMGMVQCACLPDCWCKRPLLSTFRWVVPNRYHHLPDQSETSD